MHVKTIGTVVSCDYRHSVAKGHTVCGYQFSRHPDISIIIQPSFSEKHMVGKTLTIKQCYSKIYNLYMWKEWKVVAITMD